MDKQTVIFDLEGVITNSGWREHFRIAGEYDKYNELFTMDNPRWPIIAAMSGIQTMFHVAIVTAKSVEYKEDVEAWLFANNALYYDELVMRDKNDNSRSRLVKETYVQQSKNDIVLAYDDRDEILEMYRSYGITAIKVYQ
jgi:hypothetical protein